MTVSKFASEILADRNAEQEKAIKMASFSEGLDLYGEAERELVTLIDRDACFEAIARQRAKILAKRTALLACYGALL